MDEAAAAIHGVTPLKVVLSALTAGMALLVLPMAVCVAWLAGMLCLEAWGWFATGPAASGARVSGRQRLNFVINYSATNLAWLALAVLFWTSGSVSGHAAAVAMVLILGSIGVLLFHNVPVVFLAAGAAPAMGALTVVAFADGRSWRELIPVWGVLALGVVFNLGRAIDTPSAQEQRRRLNASLRDYEILTETVTDVITRTDLNGVRQYISPACFAMTGYTAEEMLGVSRFDYHHPDNDTAGIAAALQRMLADPTRSEMFMVRVRHKDGRWIWLQSHAKLVC
ncbi:MAG TPA: PAS domain S-box protein, partial [Phenylobacterium sp.]